MPLVLVKSFSILVASPSLTVIKPAPLLRDSQGFFILFTHLLDDIYFLSNSISRFYEYLYKFSDIRGALQRLHCTTARLFLLSCERCCFQCLASRPALWVVPRAQAGKCFNLSARQMKDLATARSIPGKYFVTTLISRSRTQLLVSVRAAKELAIKLHGSQMTDYLQTRWQRLSSKEHASFRMLQRAQLHFSRHDPVSLPEESNSVNDMYNGMGTTWFPYLQPLGQPYSDIGS